MSSLHGLGLDEQRSLKRTYIQGIAFSKDWGCLRDRHFFRAILNRNENDNVAEVSITVYEALSGAGGLSCNILCCCRREMGRQGGGFWFLKA